ncbi:type III secretion system chaperone [Vibrio sp.]|uniref:type III secretion system chaperone n=1 Tax=Vibrio sp. TaxID=678 RepID=UPI00311DB8CF
MIAIEKIKYLQEVLSIKGLCFDTDGYCSIIVDEVAVSLQKDNEDIIVSSYIHQASEDLDKSFYINLLSLNLFWKVSNGCTVSMEPNTLSILSQIKSEPCDDILSDLNILVEFTKRIRDSIDLVLNGNKLSSCNKSMKIKLA